MRGRSGLRVRPSRSRRRRCSSLSRWLGKRRRRRPSELLARSKGERLVVLYFRRGVDRLVPGYHRQVCALLALDGRRRPASGRARGRLVDRRGWRRRRTVRWLRGRWLRVSGKECLKGMPGLVCRRGGGLAHVGRCRRLFFFVRLVLLSTSEARRKTQGRSRGRVFVGWERIFGLRGA